MWNNPFMRLGRLINRFISNRNDSAAWLDLLPAIKLKVSDIFPGDDLTVCYIAVCSGPKRK